MVNHEGLRINPEKTVAIKEFPEPKSVAQIRRFLGMTSWYPRFIPNFATVAEPLTRLARKQQPWVWDDEQRSRFDALKKALTSPSTLARPDFSKRLTLQTNASSLGLGAVLTQENDGVEHPIANASRTLSSAEKNYTVTEQECLAILWAVDKFRMYLDGYWFRVITDHASLQWLRNLKDPTGRLSRWALSMMRYDFEVIHREGALNHVPDALSRLFESTLHEEPQAIAEPKICEEIWVMMDEAEPRLTQEQQDDP